MYQERWNLRTKQGKRIHVEVTQGDDEHLDYVHAKCDGCTLDADLEAGVHFTTKSDLNRGLRAHQCPDTSLRRISRFKSCYICGQLVPEALATDIADWMDRTMEAPDDEWPDEETKEKFMQWVDDNLTHCQGPPGEFLDDGRVVLCLRDFEEAGGEQPK